MAKQWKWRQGKKPKCCGWNMNFFVWLAMWLCVQERTRFGAWRPAEEALHHRQVFSGLHDECGWFGQGQGRCITMAKKQKTNRTIQQQQQQNNSFSPCLSISLFSFSSIYPFLLYLLFSHSLAPWHNNCLPYPLASINNFFSHSSGIFLPLYLLQYHSFLMKKTSTLYSWWMMDFLFLIILEIKIDFFSTLFSWMTLSRLFLEFHPSSLIHFDPSMCTWRRRVEKGIFRHFQG